MGVYHLMGLGRSIGAIIGPVSYLTHRYQRWDNGDQQFFSGSGEVRQKQTGEKAGDIQALVFFTTKEVLTGYDEKNNRDFLSFDYIDNCPGRVDDKRPQKGQPMKKVLPQLLAKELRTAKSKRQTISIFWCEIDRRNIALIYDRVVQVVAALAGVGGQGKEIWVNLTGGNNVTNFALELAANLSGSISRIYYVQAENEIAEKCVHFTSEKNYWVELPAMPLALSRLHHAILEILSKCPSIPAQDIYSRLSQEYYDLMRGLTQEILSDAYLVTMWKQRLIIETQPHDSKPSAYAVGPQWELIKPYEDVLHKARQRKLTLEQLAQQENWISHEELSL